MHFLPTVGKARKPKFELHLKIYDLNNVPLVSGHSFIKWHLAHSMHAEHRGRTAKCPISNHKVDYSFSKLVPSVRISIDRNDSLAECPLELEVLQEFPVAEKITLGHIRLNLSEYVEESEKKAEDGIVRRYLMQDSKVNSTLKIGILMVQVDGERNFAAPPLRTAPVFGGIASFMGPEQAEDEIGPLPSISKGRDVAEIQDLYRRTLAASWSRQPSELTADECIEDIFSGGNGWRTKRDAHSPPGTDDDDNNLDDDAADANQNTLRPGDFRRLAAQHQHQHPGGGGGGHNSHSHHRRTHSASSDRSTSTVTSRGGAAAKRGVRIARLPTATDDGREWHDDDAGGLAPALGGGGSSSSDGDRRSDDAGPPRRVRELDEFDLRDDLVAWKLPGVAT
ncbi:respiratory complex assembly protein Rmp1 [Hirsutella rhossiliensis]|uniref:Respiratory complex assembly protein Rmp1 n=1 Tax=Hirsutella rhossiliensis TaxID=111463 RepID=A0A9P8N0E0_9HYPO|nr:respiratory complex assembly protein Rmp1 [Hirsutella rhossiliensis]KAH0964312.1 respiratory complex assembly protein Rmp1 [Hirsutella rhossiliensis]